MYRPVLPNRRCNSLHPPQKPGAQNRGENFYGIFRHFPRCRTNVAFPRPFPVGFPFSRPFLPCRKQHGGRACSRFFFIEIFYQKCPCPRKCPNGHKSRICARFIGFCTKPPTKVREERTKNMVQKSPAAGQTAGGCGFGAYSYRGNALVRASTRAEISSFFSS